MQNRWSVSPQTHKKDSVSVRSFQKEAEVETFYVNIFSDIFSEVKQHYLDIDILTRNLLIEVKIHRDIENEWNALPRRGNLLVARRYPKERLRPVRDDMSVENVTKNNLRPYGTS